MHHHDKSSEHTDNLCEKYSIHKGVYVHHHDKNSECAYNLCEIIFSMKNCVHHHGKNSEHTDVCKTHSLHSAFIEELDNTFEKESQDVIVPEMSF